jgi:hypothetical protein
VQVKVPWVTHVAVTVWVTFATGTPAIGFLPPACEPYDCAVEIAVAATGGKAIVSWPAPAAAEASADACSACCTR